MAARYVKTQTALEQGSVDNLLAVYAAADQDTQDAGRRWYDEAHLDLVRRCQENNVTLPQAAAIVAVLSPGLSWDMNLKALDSLLAGQKATGYGANVAKAQRLLAGEDPDSVVGGDKVRAFYHTLRDPATADMAVVDRHMIRAWLALHDQRGGYACSPAMMRRAAADIAQAAQQADLPTHQFQAAVWLQIRKETTDEPSPAP